MRHRVWLRPDIRAIGPARSDLEQERDRPVVDETEPHIPTEYARGDPRPSGSQRTDECVDERLGNVPTSRRRPRRTSPLAAVAVESELAHNENA